MNVDIDSSGFEGFSAVATTVKCSITNLTALAKGRILRLDA